jgi:predicted dehydrogenase
VKVALIGCGLVAPAHVEGLRRVPDVEVVATCDTDDASARSVAELLGTERTYRRAADLLAAERPDVVHVLTPPQSHRDLTIEALRAGCHVLVEKPMALDAREAREMVEASHRHGRTLGVCHNHLFDPAMLEFGERAVELGQVLGAEVSWATRIGRDRHQEARWKRELPGGTVHDLVSHPVYLLRELLGELSVTSCRWEDADGGDRPSGRLRARFEGERGPGSASVSFGARERLIRLHGAETTAELRLAGRDAPGHAILIERFYEALRAGRPAPVTAEDGQAVVSVVERLWSDGT